MRHLGVAMLAVLGLPAFAAEPGYTCKPEAGCQVLEGPTYDIGGGARLTLPEGWQVYSYPTAPLPIMAGLREIRAVNNDMVIAISPFPNIDQRSFSEQTLCDMKKKGGAQYVANSKEQAVILVPATREDSVSCKVSFTSKVDGEKPFSVLPNRRHASVTSMVIAYKKDVVYSVSVVSERAPDAAYLAAAEAVGQLK